MTYSIPFFITSHSGVDNTCRDYTTNWDTARRYPAASSKFEIRYLFVF